jgi:hypothetical protein
MTKVIKREELKGNIKKFNEMTALEKAIFMTDIDSLFDIIEQFEKIDEYQFVKVYAGNSTRDLDDENIRLVGMINNLTAQVNDLKVVVEQQSHLLNTWN